MAATPRFARRRTEERAEAFFSASDDDCGGLHARLREQPTSENSVGPSKYELQGPTV